MRAGRDLALLDAPLASAELVAVDTETNGLSGEDCELTEIGAVLVGGGELHDRLSSLCRCRAPLRRGIQRLTGITQAMVDAAPEPEVVLRRLADMLAGRVMVAHNAPFDLRVLRLAFARAGMEWPDPPVLCTAAMARALLPLQRRRGLAVLADALGIEVRGVHRALADAETCGRVLCALMPRLCAHAGTVGEAVALLSPRRRRARPPAGSAAQPWPPAPRRAPRERLPAPRFDELPRDPGVYLFRDAAGLVLYVGKSVCIRSRARSHFAPSAPDAPWREHARVVDYRATGSELGALVLENRLIKELRPPGNRRLTRRDDRLVYIRCRLDIAYPVLEVGSEPAGGHAVSIGPLRSRALALELVEQLESLFRLRHCGRRLSRRTHPSAYGQMGRCLSPCLGDLDPNLYRRQLDLALSLFSAPRPPTPDRARAPSGGAGGGERGWDGAAAALLAHVNRRMREAAAAEQFERAAALRRRAGRLRAILGRLEGVLEATHVRPRLVLAPHPGGRAPEAFWLVGGRLVDWGRFASLEELVLRTERALARERAVKSLGAYVPPGEVDEVRIIGTWLDSHPDTPQLLLSPPPSAQRLAQLLRASGCERKLDHDGLDPVGAHFDV
ncbi:MAG TPA: exonuclease domain-containing protein [Solirubrobacteraceae bacterium]|nr:exonuclease domain-containing protein [Solirubrobacteraceae bacterium]